MRKITSGLAWKVKLFCEDTMLGYVMYIKVVQNEVAG